MSKLPARLQPLWPFLKRGHRLLSLLAGLLFRRLSFVFGDRALPRAATTRSEETARREPEAVTLHPGGPAESLRRGPAIGTPPRHWRFVAGERAEVPARYVLEVADGRVSGDFGAITTPGGLLDYQTSGYFGIDGWREHPVFLRPNLGRVEHVPGTVLNLATRGTVTNYYHFLYDAIGRYGVFEEAMPGTEVDAIVVPHGAGYQRQVLELSGIARDGVRLLQPERGVTYRADRLLVPSTPNQDLDAPRWVTEWLRKRLPATTAAGELPRRLYLSRGQAPNTRRYVEEPQLWPELEKRGFVMLDPGTVTVQEQIDIFHGAEIVVSPHGAGLTNILFGTPGLAVLEMFAATYVHLGLWTIAEAVGGYDYRYLVADGPVREGAPQVGVLDDVSIPPERVLAVIDELLG